MNDEAVEIGRIEMQPFWRNLEFTDPSRGDEANWRSFLAGMNQVLERDVADIAFGQIEEIDVVRYSVIVRYKRPAPRTVLL